MIPPALIALSSLVSIGVIWFLVFWLYRDYCVDNFRQDLFSLRDRLFDEAVNGVISFDHPAYGLLRVTINGFIRYAHRITFLQVIALVSSVKSIDESSWKPVSFTDRYTGHMKDLPEPTQKILNRYVEQMNNLFLSYIVQSSPLLLITVVFPIVSWLLTRYYLQRLLEFLSQPMNKIDSTAMVIGEEGLAS